MTKHNQPKKDDASSAPESGTVRDRTSGNQPSDRHNKSTATNNRSDSGKKLNRSDDPTLAQEEP